MTFEQYEECKRLAHKVSIFDLNYFHHGKGFEFVCDNGGISVILLNGLPYQ